MTEGGPAGRDEADTVLAFADAHGIDLSEWQERIVRTAYGTNARLAVHGRPGSTGLSRPLTLRGRALLPSRAGGRR